MVQILGYGQVRELGNNTKYIKSVRIFTIEVKTLFIPCKYAFNQIVKEIIQKSNIHSVSLKGHFWSYDPYHIGYMI